MIFIDLWKAFDTVHHATLLNELQSISISGGVLNLLKSLLQNCSQQVRIKNTFSSSMASRTGVQQGYIHSPSFWPIFINDLLSTMHFLKFHACADDTIFYDCSSSINDLTHHAQHDIDKVNSWCVKNKLIINTEKSHFLLKSNSNEKVSLPPNQTHLHQSSKSTLLDCTVNEQLKWGDHINNLLLN